MVSLVSTHLCLLPALGLDVFLFSEDKATAATSLIVEDTVLFDLCALTADQPVCVSAFLCRESNSVELLRDTCRPGS